jgi:N-acetylmuramoyl-L-alanine amidase
MAMIVRQSPNRSPRRPGDPIDLVVLHATVGTFASSLAWLTNPASGVSAHYLIAKSGTIARLVDEADMAWHAGVSFWRGRTDINRYSIGIELENLTGMRGFVGQDPYPEPQIAALAHLVDAICLRHGIPRDRQHIVTHAEIAPRRKTDPAGFPMDTFMRRIGACAEPAQPTDQIYWVAVSRANVRQGPGTHFPIAGQLARGDRVVVDVVVEGERLAGDARWAHLARRPPTQYDLGFVWLPLLRPDPA